MNALVVGGTGPTGPIVVEGLLKRGYQVSILHRGMHEVEFSQPVEHIHADPHFVETLEQALGTRKFDLVVAAYGRLRHVAQVMKGRTSRLIAIGGIAYRALVEGLHNPAGPPVPILEEAPLCTDESLSRFQYLMALSEEAVMKASADGYYSATIFRYPRIYGPRQLAPQEWSIIRRILDKRRHIIIPDNGLKLSRRGYTENMAHAVLLAVEHPEKSGGQIYNVGDERVLSVREWIVLIAETMEWELEMVSLPFELARCSRPYVGRAHHEVADITKVRSELGYGDIVPAEEATRRTVRWYLENRPEPGGEEERQLGDPFDYVVEDRTIKEYQESASRIREAASVGYTVRHMYPHPEQPMA